MRVRFVAVSLSAAVLAVLSAGGTRAEDGSASSGDAAPPWMASFPAAKGQRIGIEEGDLRKWIEKTHGGRWPKEMPTWEKFYRDLLLKQTPEIQVDLPAYALSRFEVTNAQWAKFLEHRMDAHTTAGDDTLERIVAELWGLAATDGALVQHGWKAVIAWNRDVLMPVLNPNGEPDDPKWDPAMARAQEQKLPAGLKLRYARYLPPVYWVGGAVPEPERKKPIREISFEQAEDFCLWAGLHLPTEAEWERAARGPENWLFPWGPDWDPLRPIWSGYNKAAVAAKDPAFPPVLVPGATEPEVATTPCPVEVDSHEAGATPTTKIFHLLGNVTEFTSERMRNYPGSKATTAFTDGTILVGRGNSRADPAEFMLATERNCEGHWGGLLPSHREESWGIRLAYYPLPGADLTLPLALRYNDDRTHSALPYNWLPAPAGSQKRDDRTDRPFLGFDPQRTAGILRRQLVGDSPDHVFVTGPAEGVAFLPVKGFAAEKVKSASDLLGFSADPANCIVLGVLTGTRGAGFQYAAGAETTAVLAFADERLTNTDRAAADHGRNQTVEHLGALLVLEGTSLAIYSPNASLRSAKKPESRVGRIGKLEYDPVIEDGRTEAPSAKVEEDRVVLTTTIPLLDRKGEPAPGGKGIRVTLTIPFRKDVAPAAGPEDSRQESR